MTDIRINVIGGSGSGTTTVGRALASELSLPHFDSDDYFHAPRAIRRFRLRGLAARDTN